MSVAEKIKRRVQRIPRGEPFTNTPFLELGSRAAVDKALSRLVREEALQRIARGLFVRPKENRFVGRTMPDVARVVEVIARDRGEILQIHGAEAARRFRLSTQSPTVPVYYTNGPSREIRVGNLRVKLLHTASSRKLQHAGERPGMALSALLYLGKGQVNAEVVERIREGLSDEEFEKLRSSSMPAWLRQLVQ